MKYSQIFFILSLIVTICFAGEELHPTGLLYRNPRLNPDLIQVTYIPLEGKSLPPAVDLSSQMPPVGNQGAQG